MAAKAVHLDEDIAAALRAHGVVARAVQPVTGMPSLLSDRATFRITLVDGEVVKARRLSRVATARRYVGIVRSLPHLPLPAILFRHGRVTIETWVDGTPLSDLARTPARLRDAGEILGTLHATRRVGRRALAASDSTRAFVVDLTRRLAELRGQGALKSAEAEAIRRGLDRLRPPRARTGVTHNDFCAENIVEDAAGHLHVVDNGGLRPGFLDFDLARCWYRWPMPATAWETFLAHYGRRCRVTAQVDHAPFWRAAALVRSAHFRVMRASRDAQTPLRRLRRQARGNGWNELP